MDSGAWLASVHGVTESDKTEWLTLGAGVDPPICPSCYFHWLFGCEDVLCPGAMSGCLYELVNNRFREQLGTLWKDGDGATALTDCLAFSQLYCGHFQTAIQKTLPHEYEWEAAYTSLLWTPDPCLLRSYHVPEGKTVFSTPPLFLCEVFYFGMFGMIILLYTIQNLSYQHKAFSFFPLHLIYLLAEGPIIIKKKRTSNQRMATVFSIRVSCVWVLSTHTLGCMLETLLSCPRIYVILQCIGESAAKAVCGLSFPGGL